jgi:hypothetical protein
MEEMKVATCIENTYLAMYNLATNIYFQVLNLTASTNAYHALS